MTWKIRVFHEREGLGGYDYDQFNKSRDCLAKEIQRITDSGFQFLPNDEVMALEDPADEDGDYVRYRIKYRLIRFGECVVHYWMEDLDAYSPEDQP